VTSTAVVIIEKGIKEALEFVRNLFEVTKEILKED